MNAINLEKWTALGNDPIPGPLAAGVDIRNDAAFEFIEAELAKLDALTSQQPVRWHDIVKQAEELLRTKGKDLLLACFLTRALAQQHLIEGLLMGVCVTKALVLSHWEHANPPLKRIKGRVAAFEWLIERIDPLLKAYNPRPQDLSQIIALQTLIVELDELLTQRLANQAPSFNDIKVALRKMKAGLEESTPRQMSPVAQSAPHTEAKASPREESSKTTAEKATDTQASKPASSSSAPAPASVGQITQEREYQTALRLTQDNLRALANYLREKNITSAESYRLMRYATWMGIAQVPAANAGITQLRPFQKEKWLYYNSLMAKENYAELLHDIESQLLRSPFCFDGQRFAANALEKLGANEAVHAIKEAVGNFIKRFPQSIDLKFSDNTPFADEATKEWLKSSAQMPAPAVIEKLDLALPIPSEDPAANEWENSYEQALEFARKNQLAEAFALFQQGCNRSTSLREQTFWRYHQARLCFETRCYDLAISLLEKLDEQLTAQGIFDWEPEVSCKILELLMRCYLAIKNNDDVKNRVMDVKNRLCRMNLSMAYELSVKMA